MSPAIAAKKARPATSVWLGSARDAGSREDACPSTSGSCRELFEVFGIV
jgi:hypothetical protein